MKPYIVRPGDYLTKVASALRFDADTVWNDPKNAELKAQRTPDLLHPGDVLWVPDAPPEPLDLAKGATNRYQANVPATKVKLGFKDENGAFANEPYTVEIVGEEVTGTTDGDGQLELEVPVHTGEVRVLFPKRNVVYPVHLGQMDPIEEPSGVRKRLQHLGFLPASPDEDPWEGDEAQRESDTADAIRVFQRTQGMEPTGDLDDPTRDALKKAHGS